MASDRSLETRALLALYRNHPSTAPGERYGDRARMRARANREMLLAWAATQDDWQLLGCRNFGAGSLAWTRAHQPVAAQTPSLVPLVVNFGPDVTPEVAEAASEQIAAMVEAQRAEIIEQEHDRLWPVAKVLFDHMDKVDEGIPFEDEAAALRAMLEP